MRFRRLVVLLAVAALPSVASAQSTLTFASSLSNPVAGGYYVGPYPATFSAGIGQAMSLSVFCVDFLNHVGLDDHYAVAVTNLGGSGLLADTRHPTELGQYRKAAWMSSLFAVAPTDYWGSIQYAMWNVFSPAEAPDDALSPYVAQAADVAESNGYASFDYYGVHFDAVDMSRYSLITDVDAAGRATGGHQEFLTADPLPMSSVPEPATLVLVGGGLAAMGGVVRHRRRRRTASLG